MLHPVSQFRGRPARGFTLMELMVVIVILVLLIGILLPALHSARTKSMKTTNLAQLSGIAKACESYQLSYNGSAPGYLSDATIANDSTVREVFTGNENLVLSLLGGVVDNAATGGTAFSDAGTLTTHMGKDSTGSAQKIDIDRIGLGALTPNGRQLDAFYTPKENELFVVTGTVGSDNNMPELVDGGGGTPILYYRAQPQTGSIPQPVGFCSTCGLAPTYDTSSPPGTADHYTYLRATCVDYIEADSLRNAKGGVIDQKGQSLLSSSNANTINGSAGGRGQEAIADNQMAWWVIHESFSKLDGIAQHKGNNSDDSARGEFVLIAAGPDEVYSDSIQNDGELIQSIGEIKNFDDVSVAGGIK